MREIFEMIVEKIKDIAVQEDAPIYEGDREVDNYIRCSNVVEAVEQIAAEYNNGWIPCSEGLLEENKFYNVTIFDGEDYRTEPAYYARIGYWGQKNILPNWWTDCTNNAELIEEDGDEIIAWQPLPEPYTKGELAQYEDLEEQGLLIRLPCKVGDTIWELCKCDDCTYRIFPMKVADVIPYGGIRLIKGKEPATWNIYAISDYTDMYKSFYDIGKTAFLTQAEAEEALNRMKEDSNAH